MYDVGVLIYSCVCCFCFLWLVACFVSCRVVGVISVLVVFNVLCSCFVFITLCCIRYVVCVLRVVGCLIVFIVLV